MAALWKCWSRAITVAVAVVVAGSFVSPVPAADAEVRQLDAKAFATLAAQEGVIVLDVRTARELKGGRIKGARHLDIYAADFAGQLARLEREATYLVYCASGVRSAKACQKMRELGFARVFNLERGIQGWQRAGLPVEPAR